MTEFEELILKRMDGIESKLDDVRTKDLPKVKIDMALLIQEGKAKSKLHATIGSVIAFVTSTYIALRYGH